MAEPSEFLQIVTTVASEEDARRLAHALVEARLAGCVQIVGPIASVYTWEGKIESASEWLCLVKGRRDDYAVIEAAIRAGHTYDTPEILALEIAAGSEKYLAWLAASVKRTGA